MTAISSQQKKYTAKGGFKAYQEMLTGHSSLICFLYFEICNLLFSNLFGLLGFVCRSLTYPFSFKSCGKRPAFGKGMVIRGPKQIELGDKVLLDDYSALDAREDGAEISIGDYVSLGRNSSIIAKAAKIKVENGVNIGTHCRIASQTKITIGESSLIAAYCYIGPGNHQGAPDKPRIVQEMDLKGGVEIGKNVWIGARATILDGVKIGDNAVIGAHSLVMNDVAANTSVVGTPAREISG